MLRARRVLVISLLTGMLFVVGVAWAQWLASGTGSGFAQARVTQPLNTLDTSGSAVADLFPGGTGDLVLRIVNPNPYPVVIAEVRGAGEITSNEDGCDPTNHAVTFSNQFGLALSVPAGGQAQFTLDGAVAMGTTSPQACQGAVFTVPIELTGYSGTPGDQSADDPSNPGDDGPAVDCDDGIDGTIDIYDEATGECTNQYLDAGTSCDDGDPLTENDVWDGTGVCQGTAVDTVDADGDGFSIDGGDCDDTDSTIYPGAPETAGDGVDSNCDGFDDPA